MVEILHKRIGVLIVYLEMQKRQLNLILLVFLYSDIFVIHSLPSFSSTLSLMFFQCGKSKRLRSSGFNCGYKRSHSFHNYGAAVLAEASEDPASQTLPAKPSGFDASGTCVNVNRWHIERKV